MMKNNVVISIVMPVYNAEKYLNQALCSLHKQSFKDFEVICVDDGSSDNSLSIISSWCEKDSRFKFLTQQNKHAGVARNKGMEKAIGEYILFLDSDDIFHKNMLKRMYESIKDTDCDYVCCNYSTFSSNIIFAKKRCMALKSGTYGKYELTDKIFSFDIGAPWNKLYRKDFIKKNDLLFQDTLNSNDIYFTKVATLLSSKIKVISDSLIYYRVNNSNSLQGAVNKKADCFAIAYKAIFEKIFSNDSYYQFASSCYKYGIDLCWTAFEKANDAVVLKKVFDESVCIVQKMNFDEIKEYCEMNNTISIFSAVNDDDYVSFLVSFLLYNKKKCVSMNSIEYRIGNSIMKKIPF